MPYQKIKAAIVGGDGKWVRDCAPEEIGVLLVSGPAVFPGYLREQDNARVWAAEGWLNTGDLCRVDRDGYVWLTGRAKDLIIRGGHNIDPQLIEEVLATHPAVAMAAAVGQPDAYAGELPMAYVAARPGTSPTPEELVAFCRERIPERAAVPVRIVVLPALSATAVGKIFKPELRWRAIEQVLSEALAKPSIAGTATAGADERHGTLARVRLADPARADEARQVLGAFAVACEVGMHSTPASVQTNIRWRSRQVSITVSNWGSAARLAHSSTASRLASPARYRPSRKLQWRSTQ